MKQVDRFWYIGGTLYLDEMTQMKESDGVSPVGSRPCLSIPHTQPHTPGLILVQCPIPYWVSESPSSS